MELLLKVLLVHQVSLHLAIDVIVIDLDDITIDGHKGELTSEVLHMRIGPLGNGLHFFVDLPL